MSQRIGRAVRRQAAGSSLARCYTDVNTYMPQNYWDYEGLTVQWGYVRGGGNARAREHGSTSAAARPP